MFRIISLALSFKWNFNFVTFRDIWYFVVKYEYLYHLLQYHMTNFQLGLLLTAAKGFMLKLYHVKLNGLLLFGNLIHLRVKHYFTSIYLDWMVFGSKTPFYKILFKVQRIPKPKRCPLILWRAKTISYAMVCDSVS